MEMNQIRYFLSVCEHRNFTHAARATNVSQPSLTAAIKKLEDELGGPLFLRDRAGCRLTPLGQIVRPKLENIEADAREAKADAIRHIRLDRVPISIGVGETIGQGHISHAVERYRRQLPQADVELIVDSDEVLLSKLRDGSFDFVITSTVVNPDLYRTEPLYSEGYEVVVSSNHKLSKNSFITLDTLAKTNMLDRPNCEMRDALHGTCEKLGHTLYAAYRSNRVDWLLDLARQGAGAVILPTTAVPQDDKLVSIPIKDVHIEREVIALRFRSQPARPEADRLIQELKKK